MKLTLTLPLIVAVAGALTYGLSNNKLAQLGLLAFGSGLTAFLLSL